MSTDFFRVSDTIGFLVETRLQNLTAKTRVNIVTWLPHRSLLAKVVMNFVRFPDSLHSAGFFPCLRLCSGVRADGVGNRGIRQQIGERLHFRTTTEMKLRSPQFRS